ncbi:site-specific integrase [Pedobacter sp. MC2016-24]|uniref:site-specific integrase n=1 Tax=Pedobacter sp. MC2016-24 TaxID=2780090 RepID=UPI00187F4142|nr:site-specific integrase [Pedobacter sp. MC2016-24]MBE9602669.1 site-specific integrase [Pedobacter sp. MC2016-24]
MASIKVVLRKKKHTDKKTQVETFTYHLALRIIKNRKPSFIFLGQTLDGAHQWNEEAQMVKKNHPNSVRLNALILAKRTESTDMAIDLEIKKKDHSAVAIKNKIKPLIGASFFAQADAYIELFRLAGNYNRVTSESPRIKHFKEYLKGQDISFPEITVTLLKHYQAWLKATRKVVKNGVEQPIGERTIINHLLIIRTIYNQALKAKVTDGENYPFGKDKIAIKFPSGTKVGLNSDEGKQLEQLASKLSDVKELSLGRNAKPKEIEAANDNDLIDMQDAKDKLENLDLSDQPYLRHALNVWLFSFYFAGMRVSDVLRAKWADFQNDRNYYSMGKNNKSGSLKIPEKVFKIIEQYKDHEQKHDLIFPELKVLENLNSKFDVQRKIAYADKRLNKALATISEQIGLTKKLTMHIARHTFGHLAGDKISVQTLQKLYRHSSITTTIGYQANFIHKDEDTALDSVINF